MKGTHQKGRECRVWKERRKLWNYGGQIVWVRCHSICSFLLSLCSPGFTFESFDLFIFRWVWFIHRNSKPYNRFGLGDVYRFLYCCGTRFCRRYFAFIWQHIIPYWNEIKMKNKQKQQQISMQHCENLNPDIILHSYSAPIDLSLKNRPTISHYPDKTSWLHAPTIVGIRHSETPKHTREKKEYLAFYLLTIKPKWRLQ